jgi:hypothetical protein
VDGGNRRERQLPMVKNGNVKAKVEPLPTWLLTQIRPPSSSMNFREMARPCPLGPLIAAPATCNFYILDF